MKIKLEIDIDRFNMGDYFDSQHGDEEAAARLIAACMIGPDGEYLAPEDGIAIIRGMNTKEFREDLLAPFNEAMEAVQNDAVPLGSKPSSQSTRAKHSPRGARR